MLSHHVPLLRCNGSHLNAGGMGKPHICPQRGTDKRGVSAAISHVAKLGFIYAGMKPKISMLQPVPASNAVPEADTGPDHERPLRCYEFRPHPHKNNCSVTRLETGEC